MDDKRSPFDELSESESEDVYRLMITIKRLQSLTAAKFHMSEKTLVEILNGKRKVAGVRFADKWYRGQLLKHIKRLGIAAMMAILLCCFAIEGFADTVRGTILSVFIGSRATRVDMVEYGQNADLSGLVLPSELLSGYAYQSYIQPQGTSLFHVIYAHKDGSAIYYYYYPHGASASYDNENTNTYSLKFAGGTMTVWREDSGKTAICFPYHDDAFIQMEFEVQVSDAELRTIAGSLKRQ